MSHENIVPAQLANQLGGEGRAQLDRLVMFDDELKLGVLVTQAAGVSAAFIGDPSGGKSLVARHSFRLIEGLNTETTAIIPPQTDLMPQQLVGGKITVVKTNGDPDKAERTTTHFDGIIQPTSTIIIADEISRGNPHAHSSMLSALEEGVIMSTEGEIPLEDLLYTMSTMNPADVRQGSMKPSKALASRHTVGAVAGNFTDAQSLEIAKQKLLGNNFDPTNITSVVSVDNLRMIQKYVNSRAIRMPDSVADIGADLAFKTKKLLENEVYTHEAIPRLALHIRRNAMAIAALNGEDKVNEANVVQATRFVVAARVGMLASGNAAVAVDQAHDIVGVS